MASHTGPISATSKGFAHCCALLPNADGAHIITTRITRSPLVDLKARARIHKPMAAGRWKLAFVTVVVIVAAFFFFNFNNHVLILYIIATASFFSIFFVENPNSSVIIVIVDRGCGCGFCL